MTTKKSLKSALVVSGLSMLLCGAMLAGTTFAWFSDTAKSGENTITAGNLQVQLQYDSNPGTEGADDWKDAKDHPLFTITDKWEPGMMVWSEPFRVHNAGSLALSYTLEVDMKDTNVSTLGDKKGLSNVIQWVIVSVDTFETNKEYVTEETADRDTAWTNFQAAKVTTPTSDVTLASNADGTAYIAVLYWKSTDKDNDYKGAVAESGENLKTTFSISVKAKQASSEKDSVGSDYDNGATYPSD